jgi:hypothetical protein
LTREGKTRRAHFFTFLAGAFRESKTRHFAKKLGVACWSAIGGSAWDVGSWRKTPLQQQAEFSFFTSPLFLSTLQSGGKVAVGPVDKDLLERQRHSARALEVQHRRELAVSRCQRAESTDG